MAELLIQAKGHWMDDMTQEDIDALSDDKKESREARIQLGDIVVVKPDGWEWGREECLPNYLIIKLPQVLVETVEHLVQSLMDTTNPEDPILKKKRKYQVPTQYITPYIDANTSTVEITLSANQLVFIDNIIEKTL